MKSFKDFPLSKETLAGLRAAGYEKPTEIQEKTLAYALEGKDILAAAKTGSGKTLAFIIPLLECLHREKWSDHDGLGALVITPTRELAGQIFEVLNSVGRKHDFSVDLCTGGKDLKMERERIDQINIIICTPGRLQQHMEENPLFHCNNLKILIIDETDRLLDMSFQESLNFIIDFLPKERQCLLFSATQTKSVKQLARLSLNDPITISLVDTGIATPETLIQKYTVINLEQKLSFLWSFIKNHKRFKTLVFIATCKQTKFIHDLFCRMKPGVSIIALYGKLHQDRRFATYEKIKKVRSCVLLATDVAARGLDIPDVDWVVQLDCPADVDTYIHRVGRTARLENPGRSLMVLMPNEKKYMLDKLMKHRTKIPIEEVPTTREKHLQYIDEVVQSKLIEDVNLKEEAKKAFNCYIKSMLNSHFCHLFDAKQFNFIAYAKSLGLAVTPRSRSLERLGISINKSKTESVDENPETSDDDDELLKPAKKPRVMQEDIDVGDKKDIELMVLENKNLSKAKFAKKLLKKKIKVNSHIKFDE